MEIILTIFTWRSHEWIIRNLQQSFQIEYETNDQETVSGNNYNASRSRV